MFFVFLFLLHLLFTLFVSHDVLKCVSRKSVSCNRFHLNHQHCYLKFLKANSLDHHSSGLFINSLFLGPLVLEFLFIELGYFLDHFPLAVYQLLTEFTVLSRLKCGYVHLCSLLQIHYLLHILVEVFQSFLKCGECQFEELFKVEPLQFVYMFFNHLTIRLFPILICFLDNLFDFLCIFPDLPVFGFHYEWERLLHLCQVSFISFFSVLLFFHQYFFTKELSNHISIALLIYLF